MEPIKVDFTKKGKSGVKDILIPPEKAGLKILINIVLTIIVAVVTYYFLLPPMNLKATEFYMYFAIVLASYVGSAILTTKVFAKPEYIPYVKRQATVPVILLIILGVIFAGGYLSSATIFRAKAYSNIIQVEESKDFSSSVSRIKTLEDFEKIPFIDKESSAMLAGNILSEVAAGNSDLISQFTIATQYSTQVNYKGSPCRVYPLQYGDVFKWMKQYSSGIPGYILVDMHTSKASFVSKNDLGEALPVKFSPSEHFGRHLARVLRMEYPTYMFGVPSFEVDEHGNPFWIVERIDKTVGLIGGDDVVGIVMVNAVTGENQYYDMEEVKSGKDKNGENISWMDQIFDADMLIKQYDYKGRFSNGFINAYIGQEGVKVTTNGYSFMAMGDDVYMYTGVTSITSENSIMGFLLINQRTKEATFYTNIAGATEIAAQESAKGIVQDKGWSATFPLLLNLDGVPTYFMALKDDANVVKSYAMVNVAQFSDAVRSPSDDNPDIAACLAAYISKLRQRDLIINIDTNRGSTPDDDKDGVPSDNLYKEGTIAEIRSSVINSNTVYFIKLQGEEPYYAVSAATNREVVILSVGDKVTLVTKTQEGSIIDAELGEKPAESTESEAPETSQD